jgi:hypothetical protein
MVPQRDDTTRRLLASLRQALLDSPLHCEAEDELAGQDDWGARDDGTGGNVRCWLGVFSRRGTPSVVTVD